MSQLLNIDFVSDISCPWCAIGLASLLEALERLPAAVPVSLNLQPFELNPDLPEGGQDLAEHLTQKYGSTPEQQAGSERGKFQASWPFFIAAPALGRIYLFYNKNIGRTDARDDTSGILRFRYSEDDGRTWSAPHDHLRIGRGAIDHPDPTMPVNFVTCFQSILTPAGVPLGGLHEENARGRRSVWR